MRCNTNDTDDRSKEYGITILALARKNPEKSLSLPESAKEFIPQVFGKVTEYSKICDGDKIFVVPKEGTISEELMGLYMFKIGKGYDPDRIVYFETEVWTARTFLSDFGDKY